MVMDEQAIRDDLVGAARTYFTRFGYSRVSTNEIAGSVGRSKKTLYKHFPTKEDLLRAVLAQLNTETEERILAELADTTRPFIDRLRSVLAHIGVHHASLGGELFQDLRTHSPELYQQSRREQRALLAALVTRLLDEGRAQGALRSDVATATVTSTFLASAEALADPLLLATHADAASRLFDTLVTLLVDGLKPSAGPSGPVNP